MCKIPPDRRPGPGAGIRYSAWWLCGKADKDVIRSLGLKSLIHRQLHRTAELHDGGWYSASLQVSDEAAVVSQGCVLGPLGGSEVWTIWTGRVDKMG